MLTCLVLCPTLQVAKRDASPGLDQRRQDVERVRKEWRSGLKAHIEQKRAERAAVTNQQEQGQQGTFGAGISLLFGIQAQGAAYLKDTLQHVIFHAL